MATPTSYTVEINPNTATSPSFQKAFGYTATVAPNGKTLIYEGRDQPQKIEFSGVILSEAHYNSLVTWFKNRNQIQITDDLNRTFTVIIESFTPTRKRSYHYPWRHEYRMSATLTTPV